MTQVLLVGTSSPSDPNKSTLPFVAAKVAKDQGHDVTMFLFSDAVFLAKKGMADSIVASGPPPLKDVLQAVIEHGIKIYVCEPCALTRTLSENDLVKNAELAGMDKFIQLASESKVITF